MRLIGIFVFWLVAQALDVHHREYVVELHDGQNPQLFAQTHHLELIGPLSSLGALRHFYRFKTSRLTELRALDTRLRDAPGVRFVEEQVARMQYKRGNVFRAPKDPLYSNQWHLHNSDTPSGKGAGTRAKEAWDMGRMGNGIVIGIVDDGLQHTHPDLHPRYRRDLSHDYNGYDPDPLPDVGHGDFHGSSAAGVAAAACNNTHCGCGAAPQASLAGLRLIAGPVSDAQEAQALAAHADAIHIKSNSWGPMDDGRTMVRPGYITRRALAESCQHGRGGKGTIFVWAAGNGRHHKDQCGYDGYASSPYTIAVGAINHHSYQSWYSEPCAALMCVAPSSGDGVGITTTDVDMAPGHRGGYNEGSECNDSFGGTSSACPLAAGIIALVLEARPDLHWRDIQGLVANTSVVVDPQDPDWSTNSNGYHHSHNYGFGRIDAPNLLSKAAGWVSWPHQQGFSSGPVSVNRIIPRDGTPLCVRHTFQDAPMHFLEHVMLHVQLRHPHRGHVRIRLQSPQGTVSVLADDRHDERSDYPAGGWFFTSVRHWGERVANGNWTLCVSDTQSGTTGSPGTFQSFRLNVFGH